LIDKEIRGEVRYLGRVPDLGIGVFVGVALDEPYGNTDGSFNGV
jgi:dynactin complex subunit